MAISASALRANIYRLLDQVLETGVPVVIERNGRRLRIVAEDRPSRLDRLPKRNGVIVGDPGELAEIGWDEWSPDL